MYKLKEIVKLFLNVIYRLYEVPLKIFGIIDFPVPPNSNMRRTSANTIKRYIYSSLTTSLPISVAAQNFGVDFNKDCKVLDFGCGVAGQLKFFTKNFGETSFYATDVDPSSVEWVSKNYPNVDVKLNDPKGPLDFSDNFFDLIYTVSTFSHFSEQDVDYWLSELSRVTKKNGLFIPTIEGKGSIELVANESKVSIDAIKSDLNNKGIYYKNYSWLNDLQKRGPSINKNLDISSYFSDEYGHTVMKIRYFPEQASKYGFESRGSAEKCICDRQDLIVFRKT